MAFALHLLPFARDDGPGNMARDLALLEDDPAVEHPRLRPYEWTAPAITFGRSQRYADIRAACAEALPLTRRPTGGGIVPHGGDFTYALVLPARCADGQRPLLDHYRGVHTALVEALGQAGCAARLATPEDCGASSAAGTACFTGPSCHDVIDARTGQKWAGAALKRSRRGLLFQGSLALERLPVALPEAFAGTFAAALAARLGSGVEAVAAPACPTLAARREAFAARAWNTRR